MVNKREANQKINQATSIIREAKEIPKQKGDNLDAVSKMVMVTCAVTGTFKVSQLLLKNMPKDIKDTAKKHKFTEPQEVHDWYMSHPMFKKLWCKVLEFPEDTFLELCKEALTKK